MKYIIFILLCVLPFTLFAQSSDSIARTYYPNGSLQSIGELKDGKPVGNWKTYYPTGILKSEGSWSKGTLNGKWIFYTNFGDTSSVIEYNNGLKSGFSYEYFTDRIVKNYRNTIQAKYLYVNNTINGEAMLYNMDGSISDRIHYKNGKKEGIAISYDNDRIVTIKRYRNDDIVERERLNRYSENGKKHGTWKEFYPDFHVQKEMNYSNGLLDGYYKEYDEKGNLLLAILYQDGKIVKTDSESDNKRVNETFYPSGQLKTSGLFIGDTPVGIHQTYDTDGNVTATNIFTENGNLSAVGIIDREGNREGKWEVFYSDGSVQTKGAYKNGMREGEWQFLFQDGRIEQKGNYSKGRKNGVWFFYYSDGSIWREEEFLNDLNEGLYIEYDLLGNIIVEGEYFDGEREGSWMFKIGDITTKGKYVTGLQDGNWKSFYSDGKLFFEGSYIQGNEDGRHVFYYQDGSVKEERFYNAGIKVKHWKKYDEFGNLIITITYKNNREYRINGQKVDLADESPRVLN